MEQVSEITEVTETVIHHQQPNPSIAVYPYYSQATTQVYNGAVCCSSLISRRVQQSNVQNAVN